MDEYPLEYSGFELFMKDKWYASDEYKVVAFYKKELDEKTKAICKLIYEKEDEIYTLECAIRNEELLVYKKNYLKEKYKDEEEAKENLFKWIKENRVSILVDTSKYTD